QFTVVFVSIDPQEPSGLAAAKKQACVDAYGRPRSAAGWHFLTGEEAAIARLADAGGFRHALRPGRGQDAHAGRPTVAPPAGLIVLTPAGKIARYFYGVDYPARDLQYGLEDAAAKRIGSPVTQPLRMLCFDYDPATGRYTLQVMRLMRIAGAMTAAVLGLFLV